MKEHQGLYYDQPPEMESLAREALKKLSDKNYTPQDLREAEKRGPQTEIFKKQKSKRRILENFYSGY